MARKRQRIERSPPAAATAKTTTGDPSSDSDAREVTPDPLDQYDATTPPDKMILDIRTEVMLYRRNVEKKQQFPECVIMSKFFGKFAPGASPCYTAELVFCELFRIYSEYCTRIQFGSRIHPRVQVSSDDCDQLLNAFYDAAMKAFPGKNRAELCQRLLDYYQDAN